jgi:two-component system, NtrC family, nitrogen regulation sensor histidine kinase GlnL
MLLEIEDITQHKRLTRENALLAQLGGSRLMVRQLAHEIKNPLGGLRGAAQLLERELLDPALREYTRVIISEADRLTNLLDSMLGPGRPPAKQLINVHELLERVYHLLRSEAPPASSSIATTIRACRRSRSIRTTSFRRCSISAATPCRRCRRRRRQAPRLAAQTRAAINVGIVRSKRHRLVASIQFEDNGPGVRRRFATRFSIRSSPAAPTAPASG